jgi:hypothetical protein
MTNNQVINPRLESLIVYMSQVAPRNINKLAYQYGYVVPVTEEGRQGFLYRGVSEEGDSFLRDMARMHPDRDLILNADGPSGEAVEPNVINLKSNPVPENISLPVLKESKTDTLRIAIILVVAFIMYKIIKG